MEGDFPLTQRLDSSGDEIEDIDSGEFDSPPQTLHRQRAFKAPRKGTKRPMFVDMRYDSDDDEGDQPDLKEYFSNWNMKDRDIIVMCRAYASYLDRTSKANKK